MLRDSTGGTSMKVAILVKSYYGTEMAAQLCPSYEESSSCVLKFGTKTVN